MTIKNETKHMFTKSQNKSILKKHCCVLEQKNQNLKTPEINKLLRHIQASKSDLNKHDFDSWLAGFIDADGYFGLSKAGQLTCEITTDVADESLLRKLQATFGGSVKSRAGSASVRWRLTDQRGMKHLIQRVNGHIRFNVRCVQLERACERLGLTFLKSNPLSPNSGYFAGLFAGDGSITIGVGKSSRARSVLTGRYGKVQRLIYGRGHSQLRLQIDSSDRDLLQTCCEVLKLGTVIKKNPSKHARHRGPHEHYRWVWSSFDHVCAWRAYEARLTAPKSIKHRRLVLANRYFHLKQDGCHLAPTDSGLFKRWLNFCYVWYDCQKHGLRENPPC